jgi:predicted nucleic acid-binding protein
VIFVDSNIPMYLIGAEHANKPAARRLLEDAIADGEALCTDAEVLQEILHRYVAIRRPDAIDLAFDVLLAAVDVVYPIEEPDVQRARRILRRAQRLSARGAVHLAIMQRHDVDEVLSFDTGFDAMPGIRRRT